MLSLKNINKSYTTGDFTQQALKDVSLEFRKNEFVAILGPSGSGKTTLLNIIGGLDRYDSGDLIINNKSTKKFKAIEWDAYRNNCIGFVFQSYNLINHISILDNVEMGMTLSGVSSSKRRKKALEVLEKVGLAEHSHKKPNQLSGGQMQRVAIARALANDPDIILADEPTGALDSATSVQIMELIKEIAKDKLVIMVTHNAELAYSYANRIVEFKDGELTNDTNPIKKEDKSGKYSIKKTAMSFFTALKLSFNNIRTKKGRTLLTAFASSIGIIGIALILALSNGFDIEIDKFERDTLSTMPIMISEQAMELDEEKMNEMISSSDKEDFTKKEVIYPQPPVMEQMMHTNILDEEYLKYIENIDKDLLSGISYMRSTALNIITNVNGVYKPLGLTQLEMIAMPKDMDKKDNNFVDIYFDVLKGKLPREKNEIVIMLDYQNRISSKVLESLGIDATKEKVSFDEVIGKEVKLILNDEYYKELGDFYTLNTDFEGLYNSENSLTLKIVGVIRGKEEHKTLTGSDSGLYYTENLVEYVIEQNKTSKIVEKQKAVDYNVLTGEKFDNSEDGIKAKETLITYLGGNNVPLMINLFPYDFDSKEEIVNYLDKYNENKGLEEQILFTDLGEMISTMSGSIMDAITIVLIAFSAISLIVSSIMIGIITYISVLERTKEIGVLRALGARKKDITRVFNAETFIIGICSGLLGVFIGWLLTFPANAIIESLTDLPNVAKLNPVHAIILIIVSMTLTMIGGFIPAKMAAKKDPVEALRTE